MHIVSVVVPSFNTEKTLKNSIKSIQLQTYANVEIVIVDDGSLDKSAEIADQICAQDKRIKVIHIRNSGVSTARNVALQNCTGQYVAFMDADDFMEKNMLEKLVEAMDDSTDIACCGYRLVLEDGTWLFNQTLVDGIWDKKNIYRAVEQMQDAKAFNSLWNKLFRREIIEKNNIIMDPRISMGEDLLFVVNYIKVMTKKMATVELPLYRYTLSPNGLQVTKNGGRSLKRNLNQIRELKKLYEMKSYPMDGLYAEILRCFYTSLTETSDIKALVKEIYRCDEYKELSKAKLKCGKKYELFIMLLKSKSVIALKLMMNAFRFMKKAKGKAYEWK